MNFKRKHKVHEKGVKKKRSTWFSNLSPEQQLDYLNRHPNSRFIAARAGVAKIPKRGLKRPLKVIEKGKRRR